MKENGKKLKDSIAVLQLKQSFENFEEEIHNQSSDDSPELNSKLLHKDESNSDHEENEHQENNLENNRLNIIK